ncbi:MAG: hypothetical protein R2771_15645 [Saprospiraceae bacterium]
MDTPDLITLTRNVVGDIIYHTSFTAYKKDPSTTNTIFYPYQTVSLPSNYIAFQPSVGANHTNHGGDYNGDGNNEQFLQNDGIEVADKWKKLGFMLALQVAPLIVVQL